MKKERKITRSDDVAIVALAVFYKLHMSIRRAAKEIADKCDKNGMDGMEDTAAQATLKLFRLAKRANQLETVLDRACNKIAKLYD